MTSTSYKMTHDIIECDMVWDVKRTIYHHISCPHATCVVLYSYTFLHEERIDGPSPNKRIYLSRCDLVWEKLSTKAPKGSSRSHQGTTLQQHQKALKSWDIMKHTARVQSDVLWFHRAANRWRFVLMGEAPEDILKRWIHLNQFVSRTYKKSQETILCQLMLHPSYRAIWFQCGSFRLKELRLKVSDVITFLPLLTEL
jgi:hypothetical protein